MIESLNIQIFSELLYHSHLAHIVSKQLDVVCLVVGKAQSPSGVLSSASVPHKYTGAPISFHFYIF